MTFKRIVWLKVLKSPLREGLSPPWDHTLQIAPGSKMLSRPPRSLVPKSLHFSFFMCLVSHTITVQAGVGILVYRASTISNLSFRLIDKISQKLQHSEAEADAILLSSRPAWSTLQDPGQTARLLSEPYLKKAKQSKKNHQFLGFHK